ncbi:MAG TPA: hypothetical protein PL078_06635 [Bacillota bacterium]|jgi:hypothetical protein|nr:hypothetical protein [Peptococcaceae bacterium MAG4]NLW38721.1 hypothetical protein [Peptococcaceae bacterium]HPZ43667.1 hypothetical protein [Bacillota bacterium]HQD76538.1 hypothetical protein [Bacillota bacterium]HUM58843.1 hypothetical protein [Bacillota bacterium]
MTKETVIRFAKEQGYDNALYIGKWKGYDVYEPTLEGSGTFFVGPPLVILVKGQNIRMSTVEESYEQLNS